MAFVLFVASGLSGTLASLDDSVSTIFRKDRFSLRRGLYPLGFNLPRLSASRLKLCRRS